MQDIKREVEEWLKTTGYPLEMEVARSLQTSGFSISRSDYFEDSDTEKWRETDVIAYEGKTNGNNQLVFGLIAECKGKPDEPWVMFSEEDNYPKALSIGRRATSKEGKSLLAILAQDKKFADLPIFSVFDRPGYNLTVKKSNNKDLDIAYGALDSVLKATTGLVGRVDSVTVPNVIPFVWPVIVINAPLFESYLDAKGELQVNQIEKGQLIWKKPMVANHTFIDIYTKDKFIAEAEEIHNNASEFLKFASRRYHEKNPEGERGFLSKNV